MCETTARWSITEVAILFHTEEKRYNLAMALIKTLDHELSPRLVIAHATCLIGVKNYFGALDVIHSAERKGWDLPEMILLKGKALYFLNEYQTALEAFIKVDQCEHSVDTNRWIQRCLVQVSIQNETMSRRSIRYEAHASKSTRKEDSLPRHEWYQSNKQITIVIYFKGVEEKQVKAEVKPEHVKLSVECEDEDAIVYDIALADEVNTTDYVLTVTPMKIELKMTKINEGCWKSFEK